MTRETEQAIHNALLRVAQNVAKHMTQRSGWHEEDECFEVDLRLAEEEIRTAVEAELHAPAT